LKSENDPYKVTDGAHALAVLTEWDEFKTFDWQRIYKGMQKPAFIFDGRNILDREALETIGFVYKGIGS
jgi:UDPglucose 6-dehydrogenase